MIENAGKSFSSVPLPDPERLAADFWNGVNNRAVTNANILSDRNVQIRESEGNRIVVIEVPRADRHDKPVYIGSDPFAGTYRRNGERDYRCTREEALANALIHAGYYDRRGLVVQKWPDRIRITNPGAFRINVQEALVGGVSDPRNESLIKMFNFINVGERAGSGPVQHPRCLAETALENAGDHREFRPRPHHAAAAVGLEKNGDKKAAIKSGDTSGRIAEQRKVEILQYLTETPQATASEIAKAIGCRHRAQGSTWPDLPPRAPS